MIAVIGAGYWGKNHVRVLHDLGKLTIVCDKDKEILNNIKNVYNVDTTSNLDEVLNIDDIKGVVIATPAPTHYEIAKKALLSNKDVLVEKPMTLSVKEAEELVELSERHNKILMVGHILLYHNAVRKMKEIINKGDLGKIFYVYSNRLNFGKIRLEENVLFSFAPHDISVTHYLLNEIPEKVFSTAENFLSSEVADVSVTHLYFKSGIKGHIFVSWLNPFKEQKYVVIGSEGMLVFDDTKKEEKLIYYPKKVKWKRKISVTKKYDGEVVKIDPKEPLKEEDKCFIECIEKRQKPLTDGYEGLQVMRVLEASLKSAYKKIPIYVSQDFFVHPTSFIDKNVKIGKNTKIWHFCHIMEDVKIGKNCILGQNVFVGRNVKIGNRVKIQNNISVYEGVEIGDDVFIGPSAVFTNVKYPRSFIDRKNEFMKTIIKKGATIGANSTIICGVTIGKYAFIGAGAVVTRDVPDHAIVVGNPAKIVGFACKCGTPLDFKDAIGICKKCGKSYKKVNDSLEEITK